MVHITGMGLLKQGKYTVVYVEVKGDWIEVIREQSEGPISHFIRESGIESAIKDKAKIYSEEGSKTT